MAEYLVTWVIDIETDGGPVEAAREAFRHMQRAGTSANCFTVKNKETKEEVYVDLWREGSHE